MILDRYLERRAEENVYGTGALNDPSWVSRILPALGGVSTSGQIVTEWSAEGIPALNACQRAISETVGMMPLKLIKRDDKARTRVPAVDDSLYWVLHDLANEETTAFTFKELLTRHLVGWGNAYAEIIRDAAGRITALWPLPPWAMRVDRDDQNRKQWTYVSPIGKTFSWTFNRLQSPILHLQINSKDGFVGRSPIRVMMDAVGMTQAVNQFGADWFASYSSPAMTITHQAKLSPLARQHLREEWEKLRGTWGNKHRVAVLQEGMKLERMSCPPDEAQFIETRSFQIEEMARVYRVPLFVIQHMTKSTSWGSGIEQMMLLWLATGLGPYLEQWSQAIARDCLTQRTFTTHKAVWITQVLLRSDAKSQAETLAIEKANGVRSPNEWRELLDLNPRADVYGDEYDVAVANTTPTRLAERDQPSEETIDDEGTAADA